MFVIEIQDYPVFTRLGYFPQERLVGQEILVSIQVQLNDSVDPGLTDDLKKTLDYGLLTAFVDRTLQHQELKLIETACVMLGRGLLREFAPVKSCGVCVEKTLLPQGIAKGARVRIRREFSRANL